MTHPYPTLAREGWPTLAITLVAAVLASALFGLGLIAGLCWLAVLLLGFFFLHAPRHVPAQAGVVLAPADGRIDSIEHARDPYTDREALRISVIMRAFRVHPSRACVDGVVKQVQYFPGTTFARGLANRLPIASLAWPGDAGLQERNAVVIDSHGRTVTLVQVAGRLARRILCHARPGQVLTRGQCYGGVRFGSRVDVYLPVDALPRVAQGDRVSATTTILATLPTTA